jgi:hypothetical protein
MPTPTPVSKNTLGVNGNNNTRPLTPSSSTGNLRDRVRSIVSRSSSRSHSRTKQNHLPLPCRLHQMERQPRPSAAPRSQYATPSHLAPQAMARPVSPSCPASSTSITGTGQMLSCTVPDKPSPNPVLDDGILAENGELIYGVVEKKTVGASQGRLVHVVFCKKGAEATRTLFTGLQCIVNYWLFHNGATDALSAQSPRSQMSGHAGIRTCRSGPGLRVFLTTSLKKP